MNIVMTERGAQYTRKYSISAMLHMHEENDIGNFLLLLFAKATQAYVPPEYAKYMASYEPESETISEALRLGYIEIWSASRDEENDVAEIKRISHWSEN